MEDCAGKIFRRFSFFRKNRYRSFLDATLLYSRMIKEMKKTKRMQKCSFSRERKGEKGSTPKCNIPRRQTISSEIEIIFIEIRNALKKKTWSQPTRLFFMAEKPIYCEKRKERSNIFDEEDAVNFSRYFYTNLYLAIHSQLSRDRKRGGVSSDPLFFSSLV